MARNTVQKDRRVRWEAVIIVAAAGVAYFHSFSGPLVFDGQVTIGQNPTIRHLWPLWPVLNPPQNGSPVSGRPITNLSYAVNYSFGGLNVWGYHALDLAIHVLAGLTLYGIVRRTVSGLPVFRPGSARALPDWVALAAAVLWTVHPLQTESVTYLAQRSEALMGLFYFLSVYCFIRGAHGDPAPPTAPRSWLGLSWAACLFGMATKEVMVTAPIMILLYDRTFISGGFRAAWTRRRGYYVGLAGTWLLIAGLMIGTGSRGGTVGFHTSVPWWGYMNAQFDGIAHYLRLAVWPHPLLIDYGLKWEGAPLSTAGCALVVIGLFGATVAALFRRHPGGFLGAWFFVILAPTSSVVPIATEIVAEHRMYLPLGAVAVLVAVGLHDLMGKKSLPLFIALTVGLIFVTARRNEDYRSAQALWTETVKYAPENPGAHNNLGRALLETKDFTAAGREFDEAVRLGPELPGAWNNVGAVRLHEGAVGQAIVAYENALRLAPDYADAYMGLGQALLQAGRGADAIRSFEKLVRLQPGSIAAHALLAFALYSSGQKDAAVSEYGELLRLDPASAEANYNLGNILAQSGRVTEAIDPLERALRIRPDWVEARMNLGSALVQAGRAAEAVPHFEAAVKLRPAYGAAHYDLAIALQGAGRLEEAQGEFAAAARLGTGHDHPEPVCD